MSQLSTAPSITTELTSEMNRAGIVLVTEPSWEGVGAWENALRATMKLSQLILTAYHPTVDHRRSLRFGIYPDNFLRWSGQSPTDPSTPEPPAWLMSNPSTIFDPSQPPLSGEQLYEWARSQYVIATADIGEGLPCISLTCEIQLALVAYTEAHSTWKNFSEARFSPDEDLKTAMMRAALQWEILKDISIDVVAKYQDKEPVCSHAPVVYKSDHWKVEKAKLDLALIEAEGVQAGGSLCVSVDEVDEATVEDVAMVEPTGSPRTCVAE